MTITSPDYSGASGSPRAPSDSHHRRSANALRSGDLTAPYGLADSLAKLLRNSHYTPQFTQHKRIVSCRITSPN